MNRKVGIMGKYSEEEIKQFEAKDRRISRQGLIQSIIGSGVFTKKEIKEGTELIEVAELYRQYVVSGNIQKCVNSNSVEWGDVAKELNLAEPNRANVKVLDSLWEQCREQFKVSANPAILLAHIWDTYKKYPTNVDSISTILESLKTKETD